MIGEQQEVSKISDQQAVDARNNIPKRGEETNVGKSESSEVDVFRVFSNADDGILQKLGIRKPGEKESEGPPSPKKTKYTVEEFDELMDDVWKNVSKNNPEGSPDLEVWADEYKKSSKFSPY